MRRRRALCRRGRPIAAKRAGTQGPQPKKSDEGGPPSSLFSFLFGLRRDTALPGAIPLLRSAPEHRSARGKFYRPRKFRPSEQRKDTAPPVLLPIVQRPGFARSLDSSLVASAALRRDATRPPRSNPRIAATFVSSAGKRLSRSDASIASTIASAALRRTATRPPRSNPRIASTHLPKIVQGCDGRSIKYS